MRHILSVLALLVFSGAAVADVLPPEGFRRVDDVDYKITTDKEIPDYLFFTIIDTKVTPVKFDPKTPIMLLAKDRRLHFHLCRLVAVPKAAAKNYGSEKEFLAAVGIDVGDKRIEGRLVTENFPTRIVVKEADKRDFSLLKFKVEKIDPKKGIVLVPKKEAEKDGKDSDDAPGVTAHTPRGGTWFAGMAAALGLMLGGFWLASRARRKV